MMMMFGKTNPPFIGGVITLPLDVIGLKKRLDAPIIVNDLLYIPYFE